MIVLALDTSTAACSVALCRDGTVTVSKTTPMTRGHAEALMPMVLDVMAANGVSFAALHLIAVTVGPGAFTGLRVGLAAARAMALATDRPCIGVNTLEAIAAGVTQSGEDPRPLLVALDTRRGDYFAQAFAAGGGPTSPPRALQACELKTLVEDGPVLVAGDAADDATAALEAGGVTAESVAGSGVADPAHVAAIAAGRWCRRGYSREVGPIGPAPLYLRAPRAKIAVGGGRRRP